ncbi:hypothetical protein [Thiothrix nivea]|uniref:Uncharacterized protein n=1 Tax=Thiothrix nivea (strain ATCC 35100 / DSM 5205 / JP2) TaxID=870187 RepID=A0A656HCP6_THINJ|nr:hypothetical protein [Thiothrix nivea]EIJ33764.1 hypothetical protein Thini_1145 [Thiothrix nivea DSM 5205]
MISNQQVNKRWQATQVQGCPDEVALAKNQRLLQQLGGIISISPNGSVNYKRDVQRYLDKKFR